MQWKCNIKLDIYIELIQCNAMLIEKVSTVGRVVLSCMKE